MLIGAAIGGIAYLIEHVQEIRNNCIGIDPVVAIYNKRFDSLIKEIKAVVDLGNSPGIVEIYESGYGVKAHILLCMKHIEEVTKDGRISHRIAQGALHKIKVTEVMKGINVVTDE